MEVIVDSKSFKKMLNEYGVCPQRFNNMGKKVQTGLIEALAKIDLEPTADPKKLIEQMDLVFKNKALNAKSACEANHEIKKLQAAYRLRTKLDAKKAAAAGGGK